MSTKINYTDHALLSLTKLGDHRAFTEIYNRYWEKLFSVAGHKLNDFSLAEELVQDIFLDLWNRRNTIVVNGELGAYLAVAVKYKVIDARMKRNLAADYQRSARQNLSLADHSTEELLSFEELKDRLALFVARLPEKCQLVYKLSKQGGYSQKEIGRWLQISEKTVESHLSRAVKYLRTNLSESYCFLSLAYPIILIGLF